MGRIKSTKLFARSIISVAFLQHPNCLGGFEPEPQVGYSQGSTMAMWATAKTPKGAMKGEL